MKLEFQAGGTKVSMWFNVFTQCGLMFLVDHFKAYFQSRLTQLILIFITS